MAGGALAAVAAVVPALGVSALGRAQNPYSMAAWQPLVGSTLTVDGAPAVLLSAEFGSFDAFALVFSLQEGALSSDVPSVEHPRLGAVPLLVSRGATTATAIISASREENS